MKRYPNNNCGECPIWLAFEGPREEMMKLCEKRQCILLDDEYVDCDGRCLNCNYFHEGYGCTAEEKDDN